MQTSTRRRASSCCLLIVRLLPFLDHSTDFEETSNSTISLGGDLDRSVDSQNLKKSLESVYATYLPKNTHPFIYLSLEINPANVDVNVHPTKKEVHFLNEEGIVGAITEAFQQLLQGANTSRTFMTQTLLPGASAVSSQPSQPQQQQGEPSDKSPTKSQPHASHLVRTDNRSRTLDAYIQKVLSSFEPFFFFFSFVIFELIFGCFVVVVVFLAFFW